MFLPGNREKPITQYQVQTAVFLCIIFILANPRNIVKMFCLVGAGLHLFFIERGLDLYILFELRGGVRASSKYLFGTLNVQKL